MTLSQPMKVFLSFTLIITSCIALNSCSKVDQEDLTDILGDYDWSHSQKSASVFITPLDIPDKYGIRITAKGKVVLFKNGEEISKHKITYVHSPYDVTIVEYKTGKDQTSTIEISDNQINAFTQDFPFSEEDDVQSNTFLKID